VADFVGSSNVLSPELAAQLGGEQKWSSLRPEAISISEEANAKVSGTVKGIRYLGSSNRVTIMVGETEISASLSAGIQLPEQGQTIGFSWSGNALHSMEGEL
jgi:putative spermidine/putrescine transport system ATP-binding protein